MQDVVAKLVAEGLLDADAAVPDAGDAVGVEVVAEQERRVVVARSEQARPAVVDEIALVDRLQPERVTGLAEGREDRTSLLLAPRTSPFS